MVCFANGPISRRSSRTRGGDGDARASQGREEPPTRPMDRARRRGGEIRSHLDTHIETASSTLGLRANCEKNEERRERNVREDEERGRRRRGSIGTPRNARGWFQTLGMAFDRAKTPFQRSMGFPDAYTRTHFARLFSCRRAKTKKNIARKASRISPRARSRRAQKRARELRKDTSVRERGNAHLGGDVDSSAT